MFKAIATGTMIVVGAAVAAAPNVAMRSGITISNRLTPAKDARVLNMTLTPKPSWAGPYRWVTTLQRDTVESIEPSTIITDTIFQAFPTCATYRVTVFPKTVNGVLKRDSLTKTVPICRAMTKPELAFVDSFPDGEKALLCSKYQYQPRDTTTSGPPWRDSTLLGAKGDTTILLVGRVTFLGSTIKNRYTGRVRLVQGDPVRCEAARAFRESERGA